MNWSAEESLLTATANIDMTLQTVLVFAEQITWRLNVKTLAIIQSERNWTRKGEQVQVHTDCI